ncbi:MAG: DUF2281 domain-containing protein [Methanothrix sp.]
MDQFIEFMADLPPELQQEVWDYARFLIEKKTCPRRKKLRLEWAEEIVEFNEKYASLEFQKKSLDWGD